MPEQVRDIARLRAVQRARMIGDPPAPGVHRLVDLAATLLGTPLAFFTVVDDTRSWYHAAKGVPNDVGSGPVEASFCKYVIASGEPLVVRNAAEDPRTVGNPAIASMGVAAWAGHPVRDPAGEILGSFCVVDTKPRNWSDRDVELLGVLAAAADDEVANHFGRMAEEEARARDDASRSALHALREREHEVLALIQRSLLPAEVPEVAGLEIAVRYQSANPGSGLGGDWYDVISLADRRAGLVIADVVGHDAEAIATMAQLRPILHAFAREEGRPSAVLRRLHGMMLHLGLQRFLTIFYGVWDPETSAIRFQSAGHPPPILVRADCAAEAVESGRTVLLGCESLYPASNEHELLLELGDIVLVFTDGLVERRNRSFDEGISELSRMVIDLRTEPVEQIASTLMRNACPPKGYEDDVALLVVRRAT